MVISDISPTFPRLTDLLGIPPPLHIVRNKEQCLSKRASWVLLGVPVVNSRNVCHAQKGYLWTSHLSRSRIHHAKTFFALPGLDLEFSGFLWTVLNSLQNSMCHYTNCFFIISALCGEKMSTDSKYSSSSIFLLLALFFNESWANISMFA